jgi:ComF family protein
MYLACMQLVNTITDSLLHLFFPHICSGCGSDLLTRDSFLCFRCAAALPQTHFEKFSANPIARKFYGRLPVEQAMALYYFTKESLLQHLVHQLKYKGQKDLGRQLGMVMGQSLKDSGQYHIDALVPLPLFPGRERKRGYNQAELLCNGISDQYDIPVLRNVITRPDHTETQTLKGRIERWKNMEGKFVLTDPKPLTGRHILLVDDVITTGATLESCGSELLTVKDTLLSIACLCYSSR